MPVIVLFVLVLVLAYPQHTFWPVFWFILCMLVLVWAIAALGRVWQRRRWAEEKAEKANKVAKYAELQERLEKQAADYFITSQKEA
jgi:hypothetical protein